MMRFRNLRMRLARRQPESAENVSNGSSSPVPKQCCHNQRRRMAEELHAEIRKPVFWNGDTVLQSALRAGTDEPEADFVNKLERDLEKAADRDDNMDDLSLLMDSVGICEASKVDKDALKDGVLIGALINSKEMVQLKTRIEVLHEKAEEVIAKAEKLQLAAKEFCDN